MTSSSIVVIYTARPLPKFGGALRCKGYVQRSSTVIFLKYTRAAAIHKRLPDGTVPVLSKFRTTVWKLLQKTLISVDRLGQTMGETTYLQISRFATTT